MVAPAVGLAVFHFGWWTLCVEMAVLSVLMTIGALFIHDPSAAGERHRGALTDAWDWKVIRTTLSLTVVTVGYGGMTSYAALFAVQHHVEPKSIYLTVYAATMVLFRLFFSPSKPKLHFLAIFLLSLFSMNLFSFNFVFNL